MPCPCCSGFEYDRCCEPFHKGALPKNPLELMRSRYTAYVLNKPDYIIATTHPASPNYSDNKFSWRRSLTHFSLNSHFLKLKILDSQEKEGFGSVTFVAFISQNGEDTTFTERSIFEKVNERWFYRNGQLSQGEVQDLVQTTPLNLLPLTYYDHPFLRQKALPVGKITNEVESLVEQMIETMDSFEALGLAAPQIHQGLQLFVIRTPLEKEGQRIELADVQVFIDPKLSNPSEERWKAIEGCLSIPTIRQVVERPKEVTIEYTTLQGLRAQKRVAGWEARVIMHENDHLQGTLFIDRVSQEDKKGLESSLKNLKTRVSLE
jgi:peptide deformylase